MDPDTLEFSSKSMTGFSGTAGDGLINFAGFAGRDLEDGAVELAITNYRPSIDDSGAIVPFQAAVGGNATIELFKMLQNADSLEHIRTISDSAIATPNRVTMAKGGGFFLTNDHGQHRLGWVRSIRDISDASLAASGRTRLSSELAADIKLCRGTISPQFYSPATSLSALTSSLARVVSSQKATAIQMV